MCCILCLIAFFFFFFFFNDTATTEIYTLSLHGRSSDLAGLTLKMFDWLEENSPLQAMMPWCLAVADEIGLNNPDFPGDGWYYDQGGLRVAPIKVAAEPLPGLVIPIPGFPIPVTNSLL